MNHTPQILGLLVITVSILTVGVSSVAVECDHTMPVCNCPADEEICEFKLDIQHLHTFTRYEVTPDGESRGTAGRVWYIDQTTGQFMAHDEPPGGPCDGSIGEESKSCTEAFAVDGSTFRSFIGINGRIPGPTLIVNKDQYVKVYVSNQLASESISIHWHGMHQRDSHWMDGVEHLTQCGIPPGTNFTYIFQASQSGTHWYHSHSGAQRTEGLFGALIVKENETVLSEVKEIVGEFQDQPEQHTLTFLDWQYENSIDLFTQIHSSIRFFNNERPQGKDVQEPPRTYSTDLAEVGPVTYWSGLINGRGRHSDISYIQTRLSIFSVEPSSTYRFRLIGAQSLFAYRVSVDEHKLTVIATDGAFVQPVDVDYIIIHSGERYDFLLKTKSMSDPTKTDFMIRAETLEAYENLDITQQARVNTAEAILHYKTESNSIPNSVDYERINISSVPITCSSSSPSCTALNCPFKNYPPSYNIICTHVHQLQVMFPLPTENLPDVQDADGLFLNFGFEGTRFTSAINARNLRLPSSPLSQLLSEPKWLKKIEDNEFCTGLDNSSICDDDLRGDTVIRPECICTHVHEIGKDRSIQLVVSAVGPANSESSINNSRFAHPVHLHGHYFHVVDIRFGTYSETTGQLKGLNQDINCNGQNLCTKPEWASGISRNYSSKIKTAPLKDTVLIPFGGYAVLYFTADNPGYWFLHCHIEVHQLEGMGVIISEAVDKATSPPDGMPQQCGNFHLSLEEFQRARGSGAGTHFSDLKIISLCLLITVAVCHYIELF